ncbi:TPA: pilus assembly protein PilM [Legionella pneumophila]|nr:pilus assembly protein PilM [Legionella pneumophila]
MLKLLKPKHRSILGIDISSSAVKILEISGSGEQVCVEGYGREEIPASALEGNMIKDVDVVANCIKKLVERLKFTSKNVALAVPDSAVISKVVQVNEGLTDQEMEELVVIEADKYIPYPIDEINLDFEVLGHSAKNSALLDVLIVASRAENVNSRVEAAHRAGLEPKIVDVESYAVERSVQQIAQELPASGQDKIIAIVDIGANYTHLFVLHGMRLIFSREEKFGGMQLVEAIAEHYHMNLDQAIALKNQGKLPEDYESAVLEHFKDMILLQIKRTLQFFYSTSQHGFVDHILLAGGMARQPGLAVLIQEQLGVTTTVANPLSYMSFGKKVNLDAINNDAPTLMVACGLALRHVE